MQPSSFQIRTWADLPRGIIAAEQAGAPGLAHLMRALAAGRIAFLPLMPECSHTRFKQFSGLTKNRPAIVLVPDDDYQNRGPAGWMVAERAVRWAANILLHCAGAELFHYEAAVQAVQLSRRRVHRIQHDNRRGVGGSDRRRAEAPEHDGDLA